MDILIGVVERIVFQSQDSDFMVARLRPERAESAGRDGLATIVGDLPGVGVGEMLRLTGEWAQHQQHGREFRIHRCEPQLPSSAEGIRRYLGSGLIKGIGPVMAERIVERFGADTLDVIETAPERLLEVQGISRKRIALIANAWTEQQEIKALMLFLQSHAISIALASRIFRAYGAEALEVVRGDPYRLVKDVRGIGFRTADDLALKLGMSRHSSARYAAALKHLLGQAGGEGHVFLPHEELIARALALLNCGREALETALAQLKSDAEVIIEEDRVYSTPLFLAERHAALRLARLSGPSPLLFGQGDEWPADQVEDGTLSPAQRRAVALALREKVCIITGGPGVGKSTTVRGLVQTLSAWGIRFCLAAPTGRAAKRLTETTGHPAHTIHRLLQYSQGEGQFAVNEQNPLPHAFVIADEASMLDIVLFYNLLKALQPTAHLLLVGDMDQLPSVGPGNVLRDLIACGTVPTARLTELFRQARASRIVTAAYQINAGRLPRWTNDRGGDLFFLREPDPERALDTICDLVAARLPSVYGFDPRREIQVISPMHRGPLGVAQLNERLQARLNPAGAGKAEIAAGGRVFRMGDRVMQIRNDYDRNVFNGDLGQVSGVDEEATTLEVAFGEAGRAADAADNPVCYGLHALDDLVHAFAITVHKAQGSEFPCVVLSLATQHRLMLQRNLLYTALTRAKRLCVVVGTPEALALATGNSQVERRYSDLTRRLAAELRKAGDSSPPTLDRSRLERGRAVHAPPGPVQAIPGR